MKQTYNELQNYYTSKVLPEALEKAVYAEEKTELLVYKILFECLSNLEDIEIPLEGKNLICKVLKSWIRNEQNSFGQNAIRLICEDETDKNSPYIDVNPVLGIS